MSSEKVIITSPGPILPGTISTAHAKCGKPTCRCRQDPKYLHGPYYRWTGWIDGKPTTKTISEEIARDCQRRIENYKELQKKIEKTVANSLDQAPWTQTQTESYSADSRTLNVRNVGFTPFAGEKINQIVTGSSVPGTVLSASSARASSYLVVSVNAIRLKHVLGEIDANRVALHEEAHS